MKYSGITAALTAIAIAGCGGGGGSTGTADAPASAAPPAQTPSEAGMPVTSMGVITGFGSIIVNGVRHAVVDDTVVAIEDESEITGDDSALRLGMRVRIEAIESGGTRTAQRIEYDEDLKGPALDVIADSSDPTLGTFRVVNQLVTVDENTVFDDDVGNNDGVSGIDIRDLAPANLTGSGPMIVEVSGFTTETGILATRIDRVNEVSTDFAQQGVSDDELEVKGFVDSVAADGGSLVVNGATFLLSGATLEDGLVAGPDLLGLFIEVKADIDDMGNLIAVRVEREDSFSNNDDGEFEIEGVLQSVDTVATPNLVVINGVSIEVADASGLVSRVGQRIEIKGSFGSNGVPVIDQTKLEVERTVRTEDRVSEVSVASGVFTTRLGLEIQPTTSSRVEDDLDENGDHLTPDAFLGRLSENDHVEARGFIDGDALVWSRIEREDEDELECQLRGPVDAGSIADPEFSILGVTVDTTGLENDDFEDASGLSIGRAAFFDQLNVGDVVHAQSDDQGIGCQNGLLSTGSSGEVSFEPVNDFSGTDDSPAGNEGGNGTINDEIIGTARTVTANTLMIAGREISVGPDTMIDSSIVERARMTELADQSFRLGDLPETLDQLIRDGDVISVRVSNSGEATEIEDV